MKKILALVLTITAALFCIAAAAPVVTEGPIVPWRVQVDLAFDDAGVVTSAVPQVFFHQKITVDGSELVKDHGSVTWDSVAKKDETVSIKLADGSTATTTRGAVLAAVLTIAESERTAEPPAE